MSIISVKNLTKVYTLQKKEPGFRGTLKGIFARETVEKMAVDHVSFEISKGEIVGFLGPNGAGKTTTLKMLSGILLPTSGEAEVLGFTPWKREPAYQKQFALVMGQKNQLVWDLPAADSLRLQAAVYEVPEKKYKERVQELANVLEVQSLMNVQIRRLSLGERMKMELIASLLHNPKILFLDEPTIGLDIVSQQKVRQFILEWNKREGTTIILTSHYLEDVKALCERVIIINRGQKVFDDSLVSLAKMYGDKKLLKLSYEGKVFKKDFEKYGAVNVFEDGYVELEVERNKTAEAMGDILNKYTVSDVDINEVAVDEVIRDIYQSK